MPNPLEMLQMDTQSEWEKENRNEGSWISDAGGAIVDWGKKYLDPKRTSDISGLDPSNFDLPGYSGRKSGLLQQADFAAGRQAPQIGQSGFQGNQQNLVSMLEARARGEGDSVAQRQLREGLGRNVSTQQALLATGGPAGGRAAAQQAGALGGSLASQAGMLRAQEMTQAQGLLGQTLQGARGLDLQRAMGQSDAELRSRGLNDQQIARMRELELRNAEAQQRGTMGLESGRTTRRGQDLGVPTYGEMIVGAAGDVATAYAGKP